MFNKRNRWENIYLQLLNIEKNKMNDEDVRKMNIHLWYRQKKF